MFFSSRPDYWQLKVAVEMVVKLVQLLRLLLVQAVVLLHLKFGGNQKSFPLDGDAQLFLGVCGFYNFPYVHPAANIII